MDIGVIKVCFILPVILLFLFYCSAFALPFTGIIKILGKHILFFYVDTSLLPALG